MPRVAALEVPEIMDIRQLALYLAITPDTAYLYASTGFLPAFKLGNRWRFKKAIIDAWITEQCNQVEQSGVEA